MTIPEILKSAGALHGQVQMTAMRAVVEQPEAITPELLSVFETVANDIAKWAETDHACYR